MSEKYLAGFLDGDGYFSIRTRIGAKPDLECSVAQRNDFLSPLHELQDIFGGIIREKHNGTNSELCLRSTPARKCMERLKKYMVIKQYQIEEYLKMVQEAPILSTRSEMLDFRAKVKAVKKVDADPKQSYPSRKWLAGYIDADGFFAARVGRSKTMYAYPFFSILAPFNYTGGLRLIHKVFGGGVHENKSGYILQIQLAQPSKAIQFLEYFMKYLRKKKDVVYFIYECAKNGNFRDGTTIRNAVITLNSQQHRLSDPTASVKSLLDEVRFDINKLPSGRPVGVKETKPRRKRQSKS